MTGVAASAAPIRRWAVGGAALGVLVGVTQCLRARAEGYGPDLLGWFEEPAGFALAGLALAGLSALCRRARSRTAVPADHPSRADFPVRTASADG